MPRTAKRITIAELAEQTGTNQRKLRRIARKHTTFAPGRGSRYSLTAAQAKQLRSHLS